MKHSQKHLLGKLLIGFASVMMGLLAACGSTSLSDDGNGTALSSSLSSSSSAPPTSGPSSLVISPAVQTVGFGGTLSFQASGGVAPYSYFISSGSGASVDASSGAFSAPGSAATITVGVSDQAHNSAYAVVMVQSAGSSISLSGTTSKVVVTSFTALNAANSDCTAAVAKSGSCDSAAHRFCQSAGYASGFGIVEQYGDMATVVCMIQGSVSVQTVPYPVIASFQTNCDPNNVETDLCKSAFHRYCVTRGFSTGFGPVENGNGNFYIACTYAQNAVLTTLQYSDLTNIVPGCTATNPVSSSCDTAISRMCATQGYVSGFGPVEHSLTAAYVGCTR